MTVYNYIDISEKHTFKYDPEWKGLKCPQKFYKNKSGYETLINKHKITEVKYMYIGAGHTWKCLEALMLYCDYQRSQYPWVIGLEHIHSNNELEILEALFQSGYRLIKQEDSYKLPKTKYLFLYRDRTEILETLKNTS